MVIVNGEEIASEILNSIKQKIADLEEKPTLSAIFIGNNDASELFLERKQKQCEEIGMNFSLYKFEEDSSEEEIIRKICELNADQKITSIIVQLPLPKKFDKQKILDSVVVEKDIDVLNSKNYEMISPLVKAVEEIFAKHNVEIKGKNLVVIGYGDLVGKPISKELMKKMPTLTICTKRTSNLEEHTQNADIIITGAGAPNIIKKEMIKEGVILIDAGITKIDGRICGDIDFDNVKEKAGLITPVPGGLGPVMVAMLLKNTLNLYLTQNVK